MDKINRRESDIRLEHLEKGLDSLKADFKRVLEEETNTARSVHADMQRIIDLIQKANLDTRGLIEKNSIELINRISDKYSTQLSVEKRINELSSSFDKRLVASKAAILKQLATYGSIALAVFGVIGWLIKTVVFK